MPRPTCDQDIEPAPFHAEFLMSRCRSREGALEKRPPKSEDAPRTQVGRKIRDSPSGAIENATSVVVFENPSAVDQITFKKHCKLVEWLVLRFVQVFISDHGFVAVSIREVVIGRQSFSKSPITKLSADQWRRRRELNPI